jgi:hypothetical protein
MFRTIVLILLAVFSVKSSASHDIGGNTCGQETITHFSDLAKSFFSDYEYTPIPINEDPSELKDFIGHGENLITVATVPPLPTLLSSSFKNIMVVGTPINQLRFTNNLHQAFQKRQAPDFVRRTKNDFSKHVEPIFFGAIEDYFSSVFRPIQDLKPEECSSISTKLDTIFHANPTTKSVIFISTINDESSFLVVNHWLDNGHTVVFSLTPKLAIDTVTSTLGRINIQWQPSTKHTGTVYYKIFR